MGASPGPRRPTAIGTPTRSDPSGTLDTTGTPSAGGLGYHGFTILLERPGQADEMLAAYRGTVAPPGVDPRPYRIDTGRSIERVLLDTGRAMLTPIEVAAVKGNLAAAP